MNVYGTAAVNVQTQLFPLMVRSAPLRAWRTMLRIAARTMQARLSIPGLALRDACFAGSCG